MRDFNDQNELNFLHMNEVEELEERLSIAIDGSSTASVNVVQESISYLQTLNESIDALGWCITNYPHFKTATAQKFTLIMCKNWCIGRWNEITDELKVLVKELLFNFVVHDFERLSQDFQNLVCDAQCMFMWKSYPNIWPTFWNDLLTFQPYLILHFLEAFCSHTSLLSFDANETFTIIKEAMRSQGIDVQITQYVISLIDYGSPLPFYILASLFRWVNLDNFLNDENINEILKGFNLIETTTETIYVLTTLVQRNMTDDIKLTLIDLLRIPSRIIGYMSSEANNSILYASANLIEVTGTYLIKTDKVIAFFQIALALLNNQDDQIAASIAPFILQFVKEYPEDYLMLTFKVVFSRLQHFNEQLLKEDDSLGEMLLDILRVFIRINPEETYLFLFSICQSMEMVEEIPHCITLLQILNEQPKPDFVQFFEPLMSITPPLSSLQSKAICCFIQYFTSVNQHFEDSIVSNFFDTVLNIIFTDETQSLTHSFLKFVKSVSARISFNTDIVLDMVKSLNSDLITISSLLICRLDNGLEMFSHSLNYLMQNVTDEVNSFVLPMKFIQAIPYHEGAPHLNLVITTLNEIFPYVKSDDYALSIFIKSCSRSLGNESIEMVNKCIEFALEPLSITELCIIGLKIDNHFITSFAPRVLNIMNNIDDWSVNNDETHEAFILFSKYLDLVSKNITQVNIDTLKQVLEFIQVKLNTTLSPRLIEIIHQFLINAAKDIPQPILDNFGESIFNVFLSREFNPQFPGWSKVCNKILKLHNILLNVLPNETTSVIEQAFLKLSATPEMVIEYIQLFSLQPRNRNEQGLKFFSDFVRYRKSLG